MTDTTEDGFLGGRLTMRQPASGYRAGIEPVFLAASIDAKPLDRVLELGCGVGVALACLASRVADLRLAGIEVHQGLSELAKENMSLNNIDARIFKADIRNLPRELLDESFDHILANPPFFSKSSGTLAREDSRKSGRVEDAELPVWIETAVRRLAPRGHFSIIQRTAKLRIILASLDNRMGDICVRPLVGRVGQEAEHIIVSARKGAKGGVRLLSPFVLHEGKHHDGDRDSYTSAAKAILRDGSGFEFKN